MPPRICWGGGAVRDWPDIPRGAERGAERNEDPPIRPLLRAASAYSGETASATNTEPATIAASAKLNPGFIFFSASASASEDATAATRTEPLAGTAARDLRGTFARPFVCRSGVEKVSRGRLGRQASRKLRVDGWETRERARYVSAVRDAAICGTRAHLTAAPAKEERRAATGRARTVCVGVLDRMGGRGQRCVRVGDGGWCQPGERTTLDETDATRAGVSRGSFPHRAPAGRPQRQ